MNENIKWGAAALAVVGLSVGAVVYFSMRGDGAPAPAEPVAAVEPASGPPPAAVLAEPAIKHPLPAAAAPEALPPLDDSDVPLQGAFETLLGKDFVASSIIPDQLARHFVATIDNLSSEKVGERIRPLRPLPGTFAVSGTEDALVLDPANFERYESMVRLLVSTDTGSLVANYTRFYPLFQEAYESLGHPPEYFNDRVVEVIDHLLATPDVQGPIALAQPNVLYVFANPELESASAGQKALIRMGSANANAVKTKLRELRRELVALPPE